MCSCFAIAVFSSSLHIAPIAVIIPRDVVHALTFVRVCARVRVFLACLIVLMVLLCLLRCLRGLLLSKRVANGVGLICNI
jgi:hypothetical protein